MCHSVYYNLNNIYTRSKHFLIYHIAYISSLLLLTYLNLVRVEGFEPPSPKASVPKTDVYTSSTTLPWLLHLESNQVFQVQSLTCYLYTIEQLFYYLLHWYHFIGEPNQDIVYIFIMLPTNIFC